MIKALIRKLGCASCKKQIALLEREVVHWKRLALEFKRPNL